MSPKEMRAAVAEMREMVIQRGKWSTQHGYMHIAPQQYNPELTNISVSITDLLCHALYMLDKIEQFLGQGRIDKANRWIGFVQGILWSKGIASINYFRHMNNPTGVMNR